MKKLLIIIASLISVVFVICLAAVIYLANWNPNDHKQWIAEKFNEQTGRDLNIKGELNLSLYPWLSLEINQLSVSNGPEFSDAALFQTEHAELRIKLMPMLSGQYEIDTILLQDTDLNLEINTAGQANWAFLNAEEENKEGESTTNSSDIPIGNIVLGGINIQNFNISFDDQAANQHYEIRDLSMTTGELVYGQPIQLNLNFGAFSTKPELTAQTTLDSIITYDLDNQLYNLAPFSLTSNLNGPNIPDGATTISLNTSLSLNLAEGTVTLPNLELNALGTQLVASINASNIQSESPALKAEIALNGSDLALLFQVAEVDDLARQIASLNNRSFDFSALLDTDLTNGELNLSRLEANLLGASLSGEINASAIQSTTPLISGQLNASGPDLPTLLGVFGQLQGGSDSSLSLYGRQLSALANKSFNLNTEFDADLESGDILIPAFSINALGLNINGNFTSQNGQADNGNVNGSLTLEANNLSELLSALEQGELAEIAQALNMNIEVNGTLDDISINPLNLNLLLGGDDIPNSPVNLTLTANSTINLEQETLNIEDFSLSGLDLLTVGNVTVSNIFTQPEAIGNVNVTSFDLRRLLQQLNQDIPEMSDNTTLSNVSLEANFNGSPSKLNLSDFVVTLDQSTIQGNFSLDDFETPEIHFSVAIDQLNADRYLASDAVANTNPETSTNTELPLETLQALNIDGNLNVDQLTIANVDLSDISIALNAGDGRIELSPVQANLYSGSYFGTVSLNVSSDLPVASIESSLQNVDLGPLMNDFMDATYISGISNVNFSLNGTGLDSVAIKNNLNGTGNFEINGGVLAGVDVASVLAQIELMLRERRLIEVERGEQTPFENFSGTIGINNGVVRSNDLLILSPGFSVKGAGTLINLSNDTINFNLLTTVDPTTARNATEEYDLGGYALPIACTGSIDSPSCLPDTGEIIKVALAQTVERKLSDLLGRLAGDNGQDNPTESNSTQPTEQPIEQPLEQQEEEPLDLRQELINRALDRLRR